MMYWSLIKNVYLRLNKLWYLAYGFLRNKFPITLKLKVWWHISFWFWTNQESVWFIVKKENSCYDRISFNLKYSEKNFPVYIYIYNLFKILIFLEINEERTIFFKLPSHLFTFTFTFLYIFTSIYLSLHFYIDLPLHLSTCTFTFL